LKRRTLGLSQESESDHERACYRADRTHPRRPWRPPSREPDRRRRGAALTPAAWTPTTRHTCGHQSQQSQLASSFLSPAEQDAAEPDERVHPGWRFRPQSCLADRTSRPFQPVL